ncbi:MAG: hypothetical protein JWQ03_3077 [Variovorax sp.]|nr:hypothetical protein [Variovorax sp.]
MQLATYLSQRSISLGEFARQIGARNARTVQRYTKHGRIPSGQMLAQIHRATNGLVTVEDFLPSTEAE